MAEEFPRQVTGANGTLRWQGASGTSYATKEEAIADNVWPADRPLPPPRPPAPKPPSPGFAHGLGEFAGYAIIAGIFTCLGLLAHHGYHWLRFGSWPGWTIADWWNYAGWGTPHVSAVGLQRVLDWIVGCQLWWSVPPILLLIAMPMFSASDRMTQRIAQAKFARPREPENFGPPYSPLPPGTVRPEPYPVPVEASVGYKLGRSLSGWFWPRATNPESTAAIRTGRVVHWVFLILAVAPLCLSALPLLAPREYDVSLILLAVFAFALAMVGRGVRYILSNE